MFAPTTVATIAEFHAHHREHAARLRETGGAELLVCDGEPECVVLSPETYGQLAQAAVYQESLRLGRIALEEERGGRARDLKDFAADVERRFGIKCIGAKAGQ